MFTPFKNMFFLVRLLGILKGNPKITDHRDIMRLEEVIKELKIEDYNVAQYALENPWELISVIREPLLLQLHEALTYMEGVDTYVPVSFENLLKDFNYDEMRPYCPDVSFDHAGFLLRITPRKPCDDMIESGMLPTHLGNYRLDLDVLEKEIMKEFGSKDLDLIERCNREMMFIMAIFEHVQTQGLELYAGATDRDEMWRLKFGTAMGLVESVVDVVETLVTEPHELSSEQRNQINASFHELGIDGMEAFWNEVDNRQSLMLLGVTGQEDFKADMKRMAGQAGEMLSAAMRLLKERFDSCRKDGAKEAEGIKKAIDENVQALSKLAGEIKDGNLDSLKKSLEKSGFGKLTSVLAGVKTYTQLGQALSGISQELDKKVTEMKEAQAEMAKAEAKVAEASKVPAGTDESADGDAKAQIKARMGELSKEAKALMKSAGDAISESMKSVGALRSVKATLDRCIKDGEEKEVAGNESWML